MKKLILAALCVPAFAFANSGDGPSNSTTPQGVSVVCHDVSGKVQSNLRVNFPAAIFDYNAPLSAKDFDVNTFGKQIQVFGPDKGAKYHATVRVGKRFGNSQGLPAGDPATYDVQLWSEGSDTRIVTLANFLMVLSGGDNGNFISASAQVQSMNAPQATSTLNTISGVYNVQPNDEDRIGSLINFPVLCQLMR